MKIWSKKLHFWCSITILSLSTDHHMFGEVKRKHPAPFDVHNVSRTRSKKKREKEDVEDMTSKSEILFLARGGLLIPLCQ